MANFKEYSRYTNGSIYKNRSNQEFLALANKLELEEDEGDIFITISAEFEKRPDLLSSQLYGIPDLWWVIYQFNNIQNPLFDLKVGQVLRIPELTRVLDAIEKLGQ